MIVTISREFGSGGRELGKRLSEELEVPCYDSTILKILSEEQGLDPQYLSHISEKSIQASYPLTIGHRFSLAPDYGMDQAVKVAVEQRKVIEGLAARGDCIIIGRCADVILRDRRPFNIFVYANKEAKLERCIRRAPEGERLSPAEMERYMRRIDRDRAQHRAFFTDAKWGAKESYHLCIDTSGVEIRQIVPPLAAYVRTWCAARG